MSTSKIWDLLDEGAKQKLLSSYDIKPPQKRTTRRRKKNVQLGGGEGRSRMTITIHALERMTSRWPDLCRGLNDEEIARVIQGEVNDALVARRHGTYCPLELANKNVERWRAREGGWYCWTADKSRGYACAENNDDGLVVMTTLIGETREKAREKLQRKQ